MPEGSEAGAVLVTINDCALAGVCDIPARNVTGSPSTTVEGKLKKVSVFGVTRSDAVFVTPACVVVYVTGT